MTSSNSACYWWLCGHGQSIRYSVGRAHESLFGYEPDSARWPFRLARALGLSGY